MTRLCKHGTDVTEVCPDCILEREHKSNWIQTYTGVEFDALNPRVEDVNIEDIAHSLSMQCRFTGHCSRFYSVAEHSVHLCDYFMLEPKTALEALLHDGGETYFCGDVAKPAKQSIDGNYHAIEDEIQLTVCEKFGLEFPMSIAVKNADRAILMDEKKALFYDQKKWISDCKPLGVKIECWSPQRAKHEFLKRFEILSK